MFAQLDVHPVLTFIAAMAFSLVLFGTVRLIFQFLYVKTLRRWSYLAEKIERITQRSAPYTRKYGTLGLALFAAVPIPGTGVVPGAILSSLMRLNWFMSFVAVIPASAISSLITTAGITGVLHFASL